jgi:DNA-binding transcriptional LysR family regulator
MELRHLRYFVAVADELNFTRAAQRLHVAQPALSRQIRQLEEELGVQLLQRTQRRVTLTDAGRAFFEESKGILQQSEAAVRHAQAAGDMGSGQLKLAYVWGLFHTLAPALLARFRRDFPAAAAHLFDLTATEQARALKEGSIDAGLIGFAHEADATGLAKQKVGDCQFVAALPRHHPAARGPKLALKSLSGELFIAISENSYPGAWHIVADACRQSGFRPRVLEAAERGFTILGLVAGNCGIALLPESLRALPHPGVVFRSLVNPPRGELYVAWNPGRRSGLLEAFLKLCAG